ncbi:putative N-acetylmannosamine-6-phosphate 2-epimerase [Rosellinia necatrix]|uniref:Putative N-acetylmannosamine-6-phosphate 2-epimerase n=1 Tax=Rosellinia necatrix TaxID=77044 RepID=A0A1W2TEB3_ROSNE|nr:putative N-acetylmannosamine-6-phosphate 2-epimerase [Rosellinia necatrix]
MRSFFMSDEELGKKDDDHKIVKIAGQRRQSWQPARVPPRRSLKRVGLMFAVAGFLYLFIHNIPVLGPDDRMRRPIYPPSRDRPPSPPDPLPPGDAMHPPDPVAQAQTQALVSNAGGNDFNGPIKFTNLAVSLQAIANTRGSQPNNRNVLFIASSLKSAAALLPMACQMGAGLKNYVHFALLGRSALSMEELWEINGIDRYCVIIFHDARPDYAAISTNERLEKSVFRGLHHIHAYMHPQVIILDGFNEDESFFTRGLRKHLKVSKTPLIELPRFGSKSLNWITKLDSAALRMWNSIKIDISIQATPKSSGGLIRLLRSLSAADYTSSAVPHITIDLPHYIPPSTKRFLDSFAWPPPYVSNPTNERYLSLRHRVSPRKLTDEEASARFLESFWPVNPEQSHLLVLSPYAEVTSQYFNYLKYLLLEYRYSTSAGFYNWGQHLFGISLEQPLVTLDGKQPFEPPLFKSPEDIAGNNKGTPNPFLWQAPSSEAVLIMGDKWMELHDVVSRIQHVKETVNTMPTIISDKLVSRQHPSWLEHALRLARVRGYWFIYPGREMAGHLATVHGELYNVPEEYASLKASVSDGDADDDETKGIRRRVRSKSEAQLSSVWLLDTLPNNGFLWPLTALPVADWEGVEVDPRDIRTRATDFELAFKKSVGECDIESGKGQKALEAASAQDLFCNVS